MVSYGVIMKKRKFNIYKIMVESVILYDCETWRITERNKKALEVEQK
jgi:hypothetical protein